MKGINIKNFVESLEHNHELEFKYDDKDYVIQPIEENDKFYLVIYSCDSMNDNYLVCEENSHNYLIEKEVIDKVLKSKCFNGKSFFEIYDDIEIFAWF